VVNKDFHNVTVTTVVAREQYHGGISWALLTRRHDSQVQILHQSQTRKCWLVRRENRKYAVSQKNRPRVSLSNNSNNPGSVSANFGTKNRHIVST